MKTKAALLAELLKDKKIFYVNIEVPDDQEFIVETLIEDPKGIFYSVEGDMITFNGNDKTASFVILENALIFKNNSGEEDIVTTFAENGGLQIKQKRKEE